jgi:hypothetical protein
VYATQGKHDKSDENSKYNCGVVGKPGNIKRLEQGRKKDGLNNGQIRLRWSDSLYAHRVEIEWGMVGGKKQALKTGDDGRHVFTKLVNNKPYEFKMRGKSNCGKGKWSKTYQFLP